MLPFLATAPIAAPPPVTITTSHDVPVDQRRSPARSQVFHSFPPIAYMPACSQLVSRVEPDGVVYGVIMPDGSFNPLSIVEPMETPRAHAALSAMGVCKSQGVIVPIQTVQESRMRTAVLTVTATTAGESEPAKETLMGDWIRIGVGVGAIALAGGLFLLGQRAHNQAAPSRENLRQLLGGE